MFLLRSAIHAAQVERKLYLMNVNVEREPLKIQKLFFLYESSFPTHNTLTIETRSSGVLRVACKIYMYTLTSIEKL